MPRIGRAANCYTGSHNRKYDPVNKCTECGEQAAYKQTLCHDCLCEGNVDYIPSLARIKAECAKIRAGWSDVRFNSSGQPPVHYETPVVNMGY